MKTQAQKFFHLHFCKGLLLFLIASSGTLCATSPLPIHEELENKIARFHFDAAEEIIHSLQNPAYRSYYQTNIFIYKYLSTQDPQYYAQLEEVWDESIEQIENISSVDTLREVLLSDLYGKRAVIAFLKHSYFQAIRYTRLAHKMIESSQEKYGDHTEQMKIRGLFNALLGAIPRKYQWISNTLGYKGDIHIAKKQLVDAAKNSKILRQEAMFILCYVEKNMLNETQKSLERIEKARKIAGPNILMDFTLASAYMNVKQNDKALKVLEGRKNYINSSIFFIPFWDYLMGKSYYYQSAHPTAQIYLSQFLNSYKGNLFRSDANFRLAMSLTLDGKYEAGREFFTLITQGAKEGLDEDEYAVYMANKFLKERPNRYELALFRSRNLFDGGYLSEAVSILKQLEAEELHELSLAERTELYYRYGRIYHTEGKKSMALMYYGNCMKERASDQTWQQAYSAYYSGEIMRKMSQHKEAIVFYKQALAYKDYFYQTGLENRCKISLGRSKREAKTQASASNR